MLEAYWAFANWEQMADLVEEMITTVARQVVGTLEIPRAGAHEAPPAPEAVHESTGDHVKAMNVPAVPPTMPDVPDNGPVPAPKTTINLASPWRRATMAQLVEEKTGWKFDKHPIANQPHALARALTLYDADGVNALARRAAGLELFGEEAREAERLATFEKHLLSLSAAEQLGELFEKLVEPTLIDPCFVTRVPGVIIPLAKRCADDDYFADVYELAINGQEISPGYTELNDPDVQAAQFRSQVGDREEQQQVDEDFLNALTTGMPPAGGIGVGIDRLVMMLTGAASIRDVILFPLMRPQS
jgi:lysyl-tRNA synthetase class 2